MDLADSRSSIFIVDVEAFIYKQLICYISIFIVHARVLSFIMHFSIILLVNFRSFAFQFFHDSAACTLIAVFLICSFTTDFGHVVGIGILCLIPYSFSLKHLFVCFFLN